MTQTLAEPALDKLTYEAPFLIEKLLKEQIVESAAEAQSLFMEVKRYIALVHADDSASWKMYSLRVDEVWHQWVLFTWEYTKYCKQFYGHFIHHNPSNAPRDDEPQFKSERRAEQAASSFEEFQRRYQRMFGIPLPDAWYDHRNVTMRNRIVNYDAGHLSIGASEGMVDLLDSSGNILVSVNQPAREALAFIAHTGAFYVRELPGDLTDLEKVDLISVLVEYDLLRVGG